MEFKREVEGREVNVKEVEGVTPVPGEAVKLPPPLLSLGKVVKVGLVVVERVLSAPRFPPGDLVPPGYPPPPTKEEITPLPPPEVKVWELEGVGERLPPPPTF